MIKTTLKNIVESQDSRAGYVFDLFIQILIVLSLIAFAIDTIPDLSQGFKSFLRAFEIISVAIFSVEYILRVYVADKKLGYIFSFYGLVDILAILPFYLSGAIDLRSLRVVRLLRLLKVKFQM